MKDILDELKKQIWELEHASVHRTQQAMDAARARLHDLVAQLEKLHQQAEQARAEVSNFLTRKPQDIDGGDAQIRLKDQKSKSKPE